MSNEYTLFIYSIFVGIYLGVTYDLLYLFITKYVNKVYKYMIDILFFIIQALVIFRVVFNINNGMIPFYSYLLFIIGFVIYHMMAEDYEKRYLTKIERVYRFALRQFKRLFIFLVIEPFIDVYKVGYYLIYKIITFLDRITKKQRKSMKKWLKKTIKLKKRKN